jgi:hypothetical protein
LHDGFHPSLKKNKTYSHISARFLRLLAAEDTSAKPRHFDPDQLCCSAFLLMDRYIYFLQGFEQKKRVR